MGGTQCVRMDGEPQPLPVEACPNKSVNLCLDAFPKLEGA